MTNMDVGQKYPGFSDPDGATFPNMITFAGGVAGGIVGNGRPWFVDGDKSTSGNGKSWTSAFATIQEGVTAASAGDVVYVVAKTLTDYSGDPASYAETVIIPYATSSLALIGVSRGRTQGGLPQIKKGSGTTALLTIRGPGCLIKNIGFNGISSTGGGILLDDDYAAKAAFGTTIANCHFKNCVGTTATNAATGGAIQWGTAGNAWQVLITGNRFYKNVGDIVVKGSTTTVTQDVVITDNIFSGPLGSVDCNIYVGGTGVNGMIIHNNVFQAVPTIGSGTNAEFIRMEGATTIGILSNNFFGSTGLTFGDGTVTGAKIPTGMLMVANYQEDAIITRTS